MTPVRRGLTRPSRAGGDGSALTVALVGSLAIHLAVFAALLRFAPDRPAPEPPAVVVELAMLAPSEPATGVAGQTAEAEAPEVLQPADAPAAAVSPAADAPADAAVPVPADQPAEAVAGEPAAAPEVAAEVAASIGPPPDVTPDTPIEALEMPSTAPEAPVVAEPAEPARIVAGETSVEAPEVPLPEALAAAEPDRVEESRPEPTARGESAPLPAVEPVEALAPSAEARVSEPVTPAETPSEVAVAVAGSVGPPPAVSSDTPAEAAEAPLTVTEALAAVEPEAIEDSRPGEVVAAAPDAAVPAQELARAERPAPAPPKPSDLPEPPARSVLAEAAATDQPPPAAATARPAAKRAPRGATAPDSPESLLARLDALRDESLQAEEHPELWAVIRAVRRQIARCWTVGSESASRRFRVDIDVAFDTKGQLLKALIKQPGRMVSDAGFKDFALAARQALTDCSPFDLPRESYDLWQHFTMRFVPVRRAS